MQAYNDIYEIKLPISETIIVGHSNKGLLAVEYLESFGKKVNYFLVDNKDINNKTLNIPNITINELNNISKSSNIIITDKDIDIDQFKEMGFKEIFLFTDHLERFENINVDISQNIFKYTNRITFELSNMCNYASIHPKCPLSKEKEKKVLPSKIIYETLDCLNKYKFNGVISFHRYNEPLIDPRLFDFIKYAKNKCPQSDIFILTNGYYLNQQLLNELIDIGVSIIDVTAYSDSEFERLSQLDSSIPFRIFKSKFDNRLSIYDYCKTKSELMPCFWPLTDIIITRDAEVGLCHFDWKSKYSFGDLNKMNLEQIILNSDILNVYTDLTKGIRKFDLCKKCTYATRTSELSWFYSNIYFSPE